MKTTLIVSAAAMLITGAVTTAASADVMIVEMPTANNGIAMHIQTVSHDACMALLEKVRKIPVLLTLRNPYVKGFVLTAHCVLPDGSMLDWPTNSGLTRPN